jgi:hypothetical protein
MQTTLTAVPPTGARRAETAEERAERKRREKHVKLEDRKVKFWPPGGEGGGGGLPAYHDMYFLSVQAAFTELSSSCVFQSKAD